MRISDSVKLNWIEPKLNFLFGKLRNTSLQSKRDKKIDYQSDKD
jgi:hypothetical protein